MRVAGSAKGCIQKTSNSRGLVYLFVSGAERRVYFVVTSAPAERSGHPAIAVRMADDGLATVLSVLLIRVGIYPCRYTRLPVRADGFRVNCRLPESDQDRMMVLAAN